MAYCTAAAAVVVVTVVAAVVDVAAAAAVAAGSVCAGASPCTNALVDGVVAPFFRWRIRSRTCRKVRRTRTLYTGVDADNVTKEVFFFVADPSLRS